MKPIALALSLTLAASGALAQSRPQTPNLSCLTARQLVFSRGAVVLGTGGYTYDRFVSHRGFCQVGEYIEPAYAPAADTPLCFVGYRCRSGPKEFFMFD